MIGILWLLKILSWLLIGGLAAFGAYKMRHKEYRDNTPRESWTYFKGDLDG